MAESRGKGRRYQKTQESTEHEEEAIKMLGQEVLGNPPLAEEEDRVVGRLDGQRQEADGDSDEENREIPRRRVSLWKQEGVSGIGGTRGERLSGWSAGVKWVKDLPSW